MAGERDNLVAVIFISRRTERDFAGYSAATAAMERLAAEQPGYRGSDAVRDAEGIGITVSWWADEASALAWRAHPDHEAIREQGRADWYEAYEVGVATVSRSYRWTRE